MIHNGNPAGKPGLVKLYLRIGEVAELVGVQPHVLRYWESEFRGAIRPQKSKKGQRVYSRLDVERLLKVKDLLRNQGFTIAGARKVLREGVGRDAANRSDAAGRGDGSPVSGPRMLAAEAGSTQAIDQQATDRAMAVAGHGARSAAEIQEVPVTPSVPRVGLPSTLSSALQPSDGQASHGQPLPNTPPPSVVWEASNGDFALPQVETASQVGPLPQNGGVSAQPVSVAQERAPMFELVLPTAASGDRSAKRLRRALVELRQEVLTALKEV